MTETTNPEVITESASVSTQIVSEGRLYAGKYKSVEELEKAYGHSVTAFGEKAKLEKELERYKVPEDYAVPEGLTFGEDDIREVKSIAKAADMNQEQFEKTIREMHGKVLSNAEREKQMFEERRKSIGDEKINLLTDHVEKNYPKSLRDTVLNKLIKDEQAMSDVLKERDQKLNSQTPGLNRGAPIGGERYDGEKELRNAGEAYNKNPSDRKAREDYIKLATDVGHARFDNI